MELVQVKSDHFLYGSATFTTEWNPKSIESF